MDLVSRVGRVSRRRNLIVALSKMDELRARDEWAEIIGGMWPDAPPSPLDLPHYFRQMDNLSESLRLWWTDPCQAVQNLMNSLAPQVRFCALSSVGHRPIWDCPQCSAANPSTLETCAQCRSARVNIRLRLAKVPEPFRVRDPLFWVFRAAGVM